jgi:hypothetical protein
MDLQYYRTRLAAAVRCARKSTDPSARIAHEGMARAYRATILAGLRLQDRADLATMRKAHGTDFRRAMDDWENEGGYPK